MSRQLLEAVQDSPHLLEMIKRCDERAATDLGTLPDDGLLRRVEYGARREVGQGFEIDLWDGSHASFWHPWGKLGGFIVGGPAPPREKVCWSCHCYVGTTIRLHAIELDEPEWQLLLISGSAGIARVARTGAKRRGMLTWQVEYLAYQGPRLWGRLPITYPVSSRQALFPLELADGNALPLTGSRHAGWDLGARANPQDGGDRLIPAVVPALSEREQDSYSLLSVVLRTRLLELD
jgi:hypothetical protein